MALLPSGLGRDSIDYQVLVKNQVRSSRPLLRGRRYTRYPAPRPQVVEFAPPVRLDTEVLRGTGEVDDVPNVTQIFHILYTIQFWLKWHPHHRVLLHCQDGVQRTGHVISCLLPYLRIQGVMDTMEALRQFRLWRLGEDNIKLSHVARYILLRMTLLLHSAPQSPRVHFISHLMVQAQGEIAREDMHVPIVHIYQDQHLIFDSSDVSVVPFGRSRQPHSPVRGAAPWTAAAGAMSPVSPTPAVSDSIFGTNYEPTLFGAHRAQWNGGVLKVPVFRLLCGDIQIRVLTYARSIKDPLHTDMEDFVSDCYQVYSVQRQELLRQQHTSRAGDRSDARGGEVLDQQADQMEQMCDFSAFLARKPPGPGLSQRVLLRAGFHTSMLEPQPTPLTAGDVDVYTPDIVDSDNALSSLNQQYRHLTKRMACPDQLLNVSGPVALLVGMAQLAQRHVNLVDNIWFHDLTAEGFDHTAASVALQCTNNNKAAARALLSGGLLFDLGSMNWTEMFLDHAAQTGRHLRGRSGFPANLLAMGTVQDGTWRGGESGVRISSSPQRKTTRQLAMAAVGDAKEGTLLPPDSPRVTDYADLCSSPVVLAEGVGGEASLPLTRAELYTVHTLLMQHRAGVTHTAGVDAETGRPVPLFEGVRGSGGGMVGDMQVGDRDEEMPDRPLEVADLVAAIMSGLKARDADGDPVPKARLGRVLQAVAKAGKEGRSKWEAQGDEVNAFLRDTDAQLEGMGERRTPLPAGPATTHGIVGM
ncbi:unnamed protein product [Symbiodinium sp. KB8]|nr:unnamed protein product [Symbiodinium sp. KB8]